MGLSLLLACCKFSELMMHAHNVPSAHRLLLLESDGRCNTGNSPTASLAWCRCSPTQAGLVLCLTHDVQAARCIYTRRRSGCLAQASALCSFRSGGCTRSETGGFLHVLGRRGVVDLALLLGSASVEGQGIEVIQDLCYSYTWRATEAVHEEEAGGCSSGQEAQ